MKQTDLTFNNNQESVCCENGREFSVSITGWADCSITVNTPCSRWPLQNAFKVTTEWLNSTQASNYFIVMIHGVKNVCIRSWQSTCLLPSDTWETLTTFYRNAADLVFAFEFIFPLLNVTTYKHKHAPVKTNCEIKTIHNVGGVMSWHLTDLKQR
jgi:hypothetical protein